MTQGMTQRKTKYLQPFFIVCSVIYSLLLKAYRAIFIKDQIAGDQLIFTRCGRGVQLATIVDLSLGPPELKPSQSIG